MARKKRLYKVWHKKTGVTKMVDALNKEQALFIAGYSLSQFTNGKVSVTREVSHG